MASADKTAGVQGTLLRASLLASAAASALWASLPRFASEGLPLELLCVVLGLGIVSSKNVRPLLDHSEDPTTADSGTSEPRRRGATGRGPARRPSDGLRNAVTRRAGRDDRISFIADHHSRVSRWKESAPIATACGRGTPFASSCPSGRGPPLALWDQLRLIHAPRQLTSRARAALATHRRLTSRV